MIVEELVTLVQTMTMYESTIDQSTKRLGEARIAEILLVAEELAAHVAVPPHGWRWWTDVVSALIEIPRDRYTISRLARDAGVQYQALYGGKISPEDGARCAAIIAPMRDRLYRRWCESAETRLRATVDRLRTFVPDAIPAIEAQADLCARAYAPLVPLDLRPEAAPTWAKTPGIEVDAAYVAARMPVERRKPIECGSCAYVWVPRVDRPAKCPRCQRYLIWPEGGEATGGDFSARMGDLA